MKLKSIVQHDYESLEISARQHAGEKERFYPFGKSISQHFSVLLHYHFNILLRFSLNFMVTYQNPDFHSKFNLIILTLKP